MLQQSLTTRWALKNSHFHIHIFTFYDFSVVILGGVSANETSFFADAGLQEKQECIDGTCGWRRQKKDALNQGSLVVLQIMTIANERGAHFEVPPRSWTLNTLIIP